MVKKKNRIVCFAKMEAPIQHFGFGNPQTFHKVSKFGVVLISRYLLADLLLIQTKWALVRPRPKFLGFFHKISIGAEKSKKHKVFFEDPVGGHNRIKFDGYYCW